MDGSGRNVGVYDPKPRFIRTTKSVITKQHPEFSFDRFNNEQMQAINHGEGPLIVYAAPGSGKSFSMIGRIVRLIRDGESPNSILATTFTKKAADELNERLIKAGVRGVNVCTMHSFCMALIRDSKLFEEWTIDEGELYKRVLKDVVSYKNMKWKGCDLSSLEQFISMAKNSLIRPEMARDWDYFRAGPAYGDDRYVEAYFHAEDERNRRKFYTFDDMLIDGVEILQDDEIIRDKIQQQYKWIIVDEAQDSNLAQIELTKLIAAPQWNITVVGDIDQCQPAGTMVSTSRGVTPIENIKAGDDVIVWSTSNGKPSGKRRVTKTNSRPYKDVLYNIQTSNFKTRTTDNHKFTVKFNYDVNCWVVYMMYRRDLGYRIGWCKFFSENAGRRRTFHFAKRCRLEFAEKAWVLKAFFDEQEASLCESITATRAGLPLIPFEPSKKARLYTREGIDHMFSEIGMNLMTTRALQCLHEHHKSINYPLYEPDVVRRMGGLPTISTQACNLIPRIMSVPTVEGWAPITRITYDLTSSLNTTPVYSLEVKQAHNYIADGIGVENCIYEWRGAKPGFFLDFPKIAEELSGIPATTIILPTNYRSSEEIIMSAARCIRNNTNRVEIPFVAHKKEPATIIYHPTADQDDEAIVVADEIQNLLASKVNPSNIVVCMRTNAQTRALEEVFSKRKIPFVILGGGSFYNRKEVVDLLSYLRVINDPTDFDSGIRSLTRPFRYIGRDAMDQIKRQRGDDTEFFAACEYIASTNSRYARQLLAYVRDMNDFMTWYELIKATDGQYPRVGELLSKIAKDTKFVNFITGEEGGDTAENSRAANIGELIRSAMRYNDIDEFLMFVKWQIDQRKKSKKKKNAVQVSTIHKQKGLEADAVFVIGTNDGILPHASSTIEEERRLFYVAITRAKRFLHLTSVDALGMSQQPLRPSPFLNESGILQPIAPDDL